MKDESLNLDLAIAIIKTQLYFKARQIPLSLLKLNFFLIAKGKEKSKLLKKTSLYAIEKTIKLIEGKTKSIYSKMEAGVFCSWGDKSEQRRAVLKKKLAVELIKDNIWTFKVLRRIPFVRFIGICGTVAMGNPGKDSDIDLFLIVKKGRIWMTRLLVLSALEVIGKRKKKNKRAGRVCLNFFMADDKLESRHKDLYTALEFQNMIPLINRDCVWERFQRENKWVKDYLFNSNWGESCLAGYWQERVEGLSGRESFLFRLAEKFLGVGFLDFGERFCADIQEKRIEKKRENERGGQVYWGDDALIFHPEPKSVFFNELYKRDLSLNKEYIRSILLQISN